MNKYQPVEVRNKNNLPFESSPYPALLPQRENYIKFRILHTFWYYLILTSFYTLSVDSLAD